WIFAWEYPSRPTHERHYLDLLAFHSKLALRLRRGQRPISEPFTQGNSYHDPLGRQSVRECNCRSGDSLSTLAALRQAESKLQKQASVAQQRLDALRAAMKILVNYNGTH